MGDFVGFGVGDFVGFGDFSGFGILGVFTFGACFRLFASNCISLGGGGFSLGAGAGLLSRPGVLDLAFAFGAGSDAALALSLVGLPRLPLDTRFIAASLASSGE